MRFAVLIVAFAVSAAPLQSVWDGVYTEAQAKRGQPLYMRHCASCHGDQLTGGEMSPPLAGGDFLSNWTGLTMGDLFERIRKSMPGNSPGSLTREVNADITAYMLAVNAFPPGAKDLSTNTERLKQIRIDAVKP
jgi:mono/diheme cytochrome c family protein